ncbi:MAG: DNA topoisomerase VI subunit B [Candidatus Parvarchaeum acidophilus ARMAN-5_'5-way FS']|jgi:DNA topoisomerase-6 subunit B|uniref:Type 2 DNA topoisomerase 6 subunit B n=1 Tax=Candidatus Parvarchaeum acidophilus ARMAN-5_'5-way FS' TaxID=994838 RepID=F2UTY3_PARA5|nr:MAG: DNA topoisomerase VI subunit B [Candidatus Parvarchaeum acidophilus ARMAN-5_'5-way FS']
MEIAEELAKGQRAISVTEFFEKNRHLLGFDNKQKALLTCVKEAVDNSLDACEELGHIQEKRNEKVALPEITINVKALSDNYQLIGEKQSIGQMIVKKNEFTILYKGNSQSKQIRGGNLSMSFEDVTFNVSESNGKISVLMNGTQLRLKKNAPIFLISIMDNGPGIIESKIPDIFGRMLYGSKFQSMRQSRGQQGIGIHSAVLYSQLTTGKPATIVSKVKSSKKAKMMKVQINILKNEPEVLEEKEEDFPYESGTRIDLEIEGIYISSNKGLDEYVRRTALVNPHATIIYINPNGEKITYKRVIERLPKEPVSIKPHPEGLEMGIFMRILKNSTERTVIAVLENELSRVSRAVADQVLKSVGIDPKLKPQEIDRVQANSILKALQSLDLMRPQTDCLSPIGGEELEKSLKKEYSPEFIKSVTRKPEVYRGMPFQIEVAAAYGGEIKSDKAMLMRFANKIPLLFDSSSCALTQSFLGVDYSRYGLKVENKVPVGQLVFIIHIASVWVPYTNESKNSVASYPVITKEIKLALQELVRNLSVFLNRKHKSSLFQERINLFDKYGIELAYSLSKLTDIDEKKIKAKIENMLEKKKDEVKKNVEESLSKGDVISSKIESDASSEEE